MTTKQNDASAKSGPKPANEVQSKQDENSSNKPIVTRHSQTGQQQGQHGGATQGPGKDKTSK